MERLIPHRGEKTMTDIALKQQVPLVEEYMRLRRAVGWDNADRAVTEHALANSLFGVTLYRGEEVIGCGRIVGDGGLCFYVQDILVLPAYQRCGYGRQIMDYLHTHARPGAFAGLMAAHGVEDFYAPYGFIARPTHSLGPGMIRFWT
jgi:GNAT superfamily N-acetyltransferase